MTRVMLVHMIACAMMRAFMARDEGKQSNVDQC